MSHTTSIRSIKIQSIPALEAAVAELAGKGIRVSLISNATPRAYYQGQQGMGKADYVIQLADAPYDVGIYKDGENGGYEARTDFFMGSVEKILGARASSQEHVQQARMGKLFQAYAINAAQLEARRKGYSTRRIAGADGVEKLVVTGF